MSTLASNKKVLAAGSIITVISLGAYVNFNSLPDLKTVMFDSVTWIRDQGNLGPVYYMLFLGVWVACLLPCSILEMVPGYLFGFKVGVFVSIFGKNLGTIVSLLLGRFFLKDLIQDKLMTKYPHLEALEKAVEMEGFPVIVCIRCTYLPMILKNYGLSVLRIPLWDIWIASLAASIPFASMWTMIGASATNMADIFEGRMSARDFLPDNVLLVGGVGGTGLAVFLYVYYSFMKRFKEILLQIEEGKKKKE